MATLLASLVTGLWVSGWVWARLAKGWLGVSRGEMESFLGEGKAGAWSALTRKAVGNLFAGTGAKP